MRLKQIFVAQRLERCVRHMRTICHDNIAHILRQLIGQLFNDRHKGQIQKQQAIRCMMGDIDQLLCTETRIDRVADRPDTRDPEIQLKMSVPVPRQGCDTIAGMYPQGFQRMRQLGCTTKSFRITGPVHIPFGSY